MAYVDQAIDVLQGIAGKTLTGTQMVKVVKLYLNYNEASSLTNEEIAELFITSLGSSIREQVQNHAVVQWRQSESATIDTVRADAVVDL